MAAAAAASAGNRAYLVSKAITISRGSNRNSSSSSSSCPQCHPIYSYAATWVLAKSLANPSETNEQSIYRYNYGHRNIYKPH